MILPTAPVSATSHCRLWPLGFEFPVPGLPFVWLYDVLLKHMHDVMLLIARLMQSESLSMVERVASHG